MRPLFYSNLKVTNVKKIYKGDLLILNMETQTPTQGTFEPRVTYSESATYAIARELKRMGYQIAEMSGIRTAEPVRNAIGILKERASVRKNILCFEFNIKKRAFHIGNMYIANSDPAPNTTSDKTWILDVFGRQHVPELTEIAKTLSKSYQIEVQMQLATEHPQEETKHTDYDD